MTWNELKQSIPVVSLLSFNQDFYFLLSSLTVARPADFTGQGTIQKALISFLKLMSSQASYKLLCQTLTLSQLGLFGCELNRMRDF